MSMPVQVALNLVAENEWPIFPCNPMDKRPLTKHGFKDATTDPEIITLWWEHWPNAMIGVPMGSISGVFCVDLDKKDDMDGIGFWLSLTKINEGHDNLPVTRIHQTPNAGLHLVFQYVDGIRSIPLNKLGHGIEIKGEGGYIIVPPSRLSNGNEYIGNNVPFGPAPKWILDMIFAYQEKRDTGYGSTGDPDFDEELNRDAGKGIPKSDYNPPEYEEIRAILMNIPSDAYEIWFQIAGALYSCFGPAGFALFDEWSKLSKKYNSRECQTKWKNAARINSFSAGTIYFYAEKYSPGCRQQYRQKQEEKQSDSQTKTAPKSKVEIFNLFPITESIPPRPWIVPGLFLRGHLTLTAAPGGVGKSILSLSVAVMSALGVAWAGWRPRQRCKVLMISIEEDHDELLRRAYAVAERMEVNPGKNDLDIHAVKDPNNIIVAKYDNRTRSMIKQPLMNDITKLILEQKYDIVIVDPFAETFEGEETNTELKYIGALWRDVARKAKCAIWLIHHTKKYAQNMAGDIDAARGATALGNIARVGTTMFFMTEDEAVTYGIQKDERVNYVRFDDAKANYHMRTGKAQWFKSETVQLDNGYNDIPGDNVGVLMPWHEPIMSDIDQEKILSIIGEIDRGICDEKGNFLGEYYTYHNKQKKDDEMNRFVGLLLEKRLNMNSAQAIELIKRWKASNLLVEFKYKNSDRNWRGGCGSMTKKEAMAALPEAQGKMFKKEPK